MLTEEMCYYRLLTLFIFDREGGVTNTNDDLQRK